MARKTPSSSGENVSSLLGGFTAPTDSKTSPSLSLKSSPGRGFKAVLTRFAISASGGSGDCGRGGARGAFSSPPVSRKRGGVTLWAWLHCMAQVSPGSVGSHGKTS
jgi:hypothetical protein